MGSEAQIKHMVDRFLAWHLPEDFAPDGGISWDPVLNAGTQWAGPRDATGTNLLTATQAEAMVRFMLEGAGSSEARSPATLQLVAAAEALEGVIDEQVYDQIARDDFDTPDNAVFDISIESGAYRRLKQALNALRSEDIAHSKVEGK